MPETITYTAESPTNLEYFLATIGLDPTNSNDQRIFDNIRAEAQRGLQRIFNSQQHLQQNGDFSTSLHLRQIDEVVLQEEISRIVALSEPETRGIYVTADRDTDGSGQNWIVRYMLWFESDRRFGGSLDSAG